MPVTVVVGGQFGSEGKGKVAHILARDEGAVAAVRVGGTNSGHTVIGPTGRPIILRQLPTAAILSDVMCVLGAGSYVDPNILFKEIALSGLPEDRLLIDPNATIITEADQEEERRSSLKQSIGSTLSGTGAAVCRRIGRDFSVHLARNDERLSCFIKSPLPFLRAQLDSGKRVLIEGTQGFGLSLLHSPNYPYATSRDTIAASFVAEAGLSPRDVDDIVLVLRAFPIRVGGNSGPLIDEVDWQTVSEESGSCFPFQEFTSVTKSLRRVGRFHPEIVRLAIETNSPTRLVLNHLDYVDISCHESRVLSDKAKRFLRQIEAAIERSIDFIGLGPASLVSRHELLS